MEDSPRYFERHVVPDTVAFRPGDEVRKALAWRGSRPGVTTRRDLKRYYTTLAADLAAANFTPREARFLYAVLGEIVQNGFVDPDLLWARAEQQMRLHAVDEAVGIDGPSLVARMKAWPRSLAFAVIDALERMGQLTLLLGPSQDIDERLRRVGLIAPRRP